MGTASSGAGAGEGSGRHSIEADLISRLRGLPVGPVPDPQFTAELRSQLVAIAPRIVAESAIEPAFDARKSPRPSLLRAIRRPLIAFAGSAAVLVLLLGLAVWMANGALPGQSMYGVKRASENFQLSLAGSDTDKGKAYLDQAASRATEAAKLAGGSSTLPNARSNSLITNTLNTADSDLRSGMALLGKAAVNQKSASPLATMNSWASQQYNRLAELQRRLPAGQAQSKVAASITLVQSAASRASQLTADIGCGCLSTAHSDDLGPLPCAGCSTSTPKAPIPPVVPTGVAPTARPS